MVWTAIAINLGIALLSAGVAYAMRDRSKPPPAEPPPFDPRAEVPQITESAPIPVVFGTRMIGSPNIVHIGAYSATQEAVRTGDGNLVIRDSPEGQEPWRIRCDLVFAVCLGPVDAIVRVDVDDKTLVGPSDLDRVGSGVALDLSAGVDQVQVSDPVFFSEDPFPGAYAQFTPGNDGIAGRISASPGGPSDTLLVADQHGYPTADLGQLRGVLSVTLRGLPAGSPDDFLERAGAPFYHGVSGRLRPWRFFVERIMRRGFDDPQWYSAQARISRFTMTGGSAYCMNPAHIVHEILTDRAWGLGLDEDLIDDFNFKVAADLFKTQGPGMSMVWNRESTHADIIREVERSTDSIVYFDEREGKWRIKPIRADYVVGELDVLDASNVVSCNSYVVPSTDDLPTSVEIIYWCREEMRERVYTVHDQAAILSRGRVIHETIRYPGVVAAGDIVLIAHRDLRQLSRPRATIEIEVTASAAEDLRRGDPFRFTWDEYGVDSVFRVVSINLGTVLDPTVTIEAIEDVFTDRDSFTEEPDPSDGDDPLGAPVSCIPSMEEAPYQLWRREPFQPNPLDPWIQPDEDYWRNRLIVWSPWPVDADDNPRWDHSGFRVAEQQYDVDTDTGEGTIGLGQEGQWCPVCTITVEMERKMVGTLAGGVPDEIFNTAQVLTHDSPFWTPRVGDIIRVIADPPIWSPELTFDQSGPPPRRYDYSHLERPATFGDKFGITISATAEYMLVVGVDNANEVRVLRGLWDSVMHETVPAQDAMVVGWVPVTEYPGDDNSGDAWFDINPSGYVGYGAMTRTRTYDRASEADPITLDVRALSIAATEQDWADATQVLMDLTEPASLDVNPVQIQRAIRPAPPAALRVYDDQDSEEVKIYAETRSRTSDYWVPASLLERNLLAAPPDAIEPELDPEIYYEAWFFDGTTDPPEFITIRPYSAAEGGFVWSNADEKDAHFTKYGTNELFDELWIAVLANDRTMQEAGDPKGIPSYQFWRYHLDRTEYAEVDLTATITLSGEPVRTHAAAADLVGTITLSGEPVYTEASNFPKIRDSSTGGEANISGGTGSVTVDLPTYETGDLLLMFITLVTEDPTNIRTTANFSVTDWTDPDWGRWAATDGASEDLVESDVFHRIADGSEGSTVNVSYSYDSTDDPDLSVVILSISGHYGDLTEDTITGDSTGAFGDSVNSVNGPSLSPPWGSAETLWLTSAHTSRTFDVFSSGDEPTGFTFQASANYDEAGTAVASREEDTATLDPGAWGSGAEPWVALTVAIRPAVEAGAAPTVAEMGGVFHLDASVSGSLTLVGSDVDEWACQVGSVFTSVIAQTEAKRPQYSATSFNSSYPGLTTDGGSESLHAASGTVTANASTDWELYAVVDQQVADSYVLDIQSGRLIFVAEDPTGAGPAIYDGSFRNVGDSDVTGPQVLTFVCDGTAGEVEIFRNGTSIGTATYTPRSLDDAIGVLGNYSSGGNGFGGVTAELVLCDQINSSTDRNAFIAALQDKWGLS